MNPEEMEGHRLIVSELSASAAHAPGDLEHLSSAANQLRDDTLNAARSVGRTRTTLRALERDSTTFRDGDRFQNRAITLARSIERDLARLLEREHVVLRLFGRGFAADYAPAMRMVTDLKTRMVANRAAGARTVADESVELSSSIERALQVRSPSTWEKWVYSASGTLLHGLLVLSQFGDGLRPPSLGE